MNFITLNFDPTSIANSNLITGEVWNLSVATVRTIVVNNGLFYTNSLVIKLVSTNATLVKGTDYTLEGFDAVVTAATGFETASAINFNNTNLTESVSIQYQAVGGLEGQNNALVTQLRDTLNVLSLESPTWTQVLNKPDFYPPATHVHSPLTDLIGLNAVSNALNKIFDSLNNNRVPALGGESLNNKIERILGVITAQRADINKLGNILANIPDLSTVGFTSIVSFGCRTGGLFDNTLYLQQAVNSGLDIYVPEGIWYISGSILLNGNGSKIIASPKAIIRKLNTCIGFQIFGQKWQLLGVSVDSNGYAGAGIFVFGSYNLIDGCEIYGSAYQLNDGTWVVPGGAHGVALDGQNTTCKGNRVVNSYIHQVGGGGLTSNAAGANIKANNVIIQCGNECITSDLPSNDAIVNSNYCEQGCLSGGVGNIGIDRALGGTVSSNVSFNCANGYPGLTFQNNVGDTTGVTINGNVLDGNNGGLWLKFNMVQFTGYITPIPNTNTSLLTVTNVPNGQSISIASPRYLVSDGTTILDRTKILTDTTYVDGSGHTQSITGTGGVGTYVVSNSQAVSSQLMTAGGSTKNCVVAANVFRNNTNYDIKVDAGCTGNSLSGNSTDAVILDYNIGGVNPKSGINSSFRVYLSNPQGNMTGDGTTQQIMFDTASFNTTSVYSLVNGFFTSKVTAIYSFSISILTTGLASATSATLKLVQSGSNSQTIQTTADIDSGATSINLTLSDSFSLQRGDIVTAYLTVSGTSKNWGIPANQLYTWFSGNLIS